MSSLSKALQTIINLKFTQLEQNDQRFAEYKDMILRSIEGKIPSEQLELLLEAVSNPEAPRWNPNTTLLDSKKLDRYSTINIFTEDTTVISDEKKLEWCQDLLESLDTETEKYKYAKLFSKLINESDESEEEAASNVSAPREEMMKQRTEFDSLVFTDPKKVTEANITAYLDDLFSDAEKDLENLRARVTTFCNKFVPDLNNQDSITITTQDVSTSISNLISDGLMDNKNTKVLRDFQSSPAILSEIADVLNAKLASVGTWSWPKEGLVASMRRQLNGKYRIYVHSDLIDSIFTQYIGSCWAVSFRKFFVEFSNGAAWQRGIDERVEKNFRKFYYGHLGWTENPGINDMRTNQQYDKYFMVQFAKSKHEVKPSYDDFDSSTPTRVNFAHLKQDFLHLFITELELSKVLKREHTIIRSDFSWFGPSLSHTTILAVLKFIGVTDSWMRFFKTFLEIPMKFEMDGPDAEVRVRARGTPMSYSLSELFGETVLFMLDFTVNKSTKGLFMYRSHDDFWIWHHDKALCATAWKAIGKFNEAMGLAINEDKTGSITIGGDPHPDLPDGLIKWGFLTLQPDGKLIIDQANVDEHIIEMKRQLADPKAILSWVKSYNTYVTRFLPHNFGEPAPCFGHEHVDDIIQTLDRVHKEIFKEHDGCVAKYLSDVIEKRYGVKDLTLGWFYLPIEWGGLDLRNARFPFAYLRTLKIKKDAKNLKNGVKPPLPLFGECVKKDLAEYKQLKIAWSNGTYVPPKKCNPNLIYSTEAKDFPSFETFTKERELWLSWWHEKYSELLQLAERTRVEIPQPSDDRMRDFPSSLSSIRNKEVQDHLKMVYAVYGEEMISKWGGIKPVWDQCLPLGMIELWNKKRPVWTL